VGLWEANYPSTLHQINLIKTTNFDKHPQALKGTHNHHKKSSKS